VCPGTAIAPKKSTHPSDTVKYPDTDPPVCSGGTETEKSQGAAKAGSAVARVNATVTAAAEITKSMRLIIAPYFPRRLLPTIPGGVSNTLINTNK
jgi:hypothetical protein